MTVEAEHRGLVIGIIRGDTSGTLRLADAASREPGVIVGDAPLDDAIDGLLVDASLDERPTLLQRIGMQARVPILTESPIAEDAHRADVVASSLTDQTALVAANPLRFAIHTRRLLEELDQVDDALQTYFAAWRFRPDSSTAHALPQLLDFLGALCPGDVVRVSAMRSSGRALLTVTLRYASDVLGTIEIGSHLPGAFPGSSELVLECLCRDSVYLCVPGAQAVVAFGRDAGAYDWQPDPATLIVRSFITWLRGGRRPPGSVLNDLSALRLCDRLR
jgi:hypothetical protein